MKAVIQIDDNDLLPPTIKEGYITVEIYWDNGDSQTEYFKSLDEILPFLKKLGKNWCISFISENYILVQEFYAPKKNPIRKRPFF